MKRIALLVFGLLLSVTAMAQPKQDKDIDPETRAERMTERMEKDLELSADQKTAVYDANLALISEAKDSRESKKAAGDKHDEVMKEILSDTQYASFVKTRDERRENRGERKEK